ncbi:MAG TPA: chemotaxis response regulator protein-glutamate methylesterase [Blastocatellia bacterium]|nr:chemotaxis response regulator protein-glutamate methylesterase [Blastocatellia bacterium]
MADDQMVKVLVVDDSAVMRKLISGILDRDAGIEVVATAIDGDFALNKIDQIKPDVITMDIDMPRMDGITALRHIVARCSIPVVMLSSLTATGAAMTMQALELGAVDFVCKPRSVADITNVGEELILKVKGAARLKRGIRRFAPSLGARDYGDHKKALEDTGSNKIVAIGASSGGPYALRSFLPQIPHGFDAGIVVVQHMPESFTTMLAHWLDEICEIRVKEATNGEKVTAGGALIAPAGYHMSIKKRITGAEVILERGNPVNGHMPSVDVLFRSVAKEYGSDAIGVIMTGMGNDGSVAIGEIKEAGGKAIAQDEKSCAVYGMPRLAVERGYVNNVVSLSGMAEYLVVEVGVRNEIERGRNAEARF